MKQVKTLITAVVVMFLMAGINTVQAQATPSKVCHVASQELVEQLPQAKSADKQLRDLAKTYEATLGEMDKELQNKAEQLKSLAESRSDEENQRAYQELMAGQKKLEEYYQSSQQAMAQKRTDLLKPLYKKVRDAIQKVARAKGFDYVLDSTTGTGVIMADGYDITPDVKKELGITQ